MQLRCAVASHNSFKVKMRWVVSRGSVLAVGCWDNDKVGGWNHPLFGFLTVKCCFRCKVRTDSEWNFRTMSKNLMMSPHVDNHSRHVAEGFARNSGWDRAPHSEPLPERGSSWLRVPSIKRRGDHHPPASAAKKINSNSTSSCLSPGKHVCRMQTITESDPHINFSLSLSLHIYTNKYIYIYILYYIIYMFFSCFLFALFSVWPTLATTPRPPFSPKNQAPPPWPSPACSRSAEIVVGTAALAGGPNASIHVLGHCGRFLHSTSLNHCMRFTGQGEACEAPVGILSRFCVYFVNWLCWPHLLTKGQSYEQSRSIKHIISGTCYATALFHLYRDFLSFEADSPSTSLNGITSGLLPKEPRRASIASMGNAAICRRPLTKCKNQREVKA